MAFIDFTETRAMIENYLHDNFTTCPIQYENVPLEDPNPSEYIALFDSMRASEGETLGSISSARRGSLLIKIFTKKGTGVVKAKIIASELSVLISGKTIEAIDFQQGELFPAPEEENINYYQHSLKFSYVYIHGENAFCATL